MKTITLLLTILLGSISLAQTNLEYVYFSGALDPKIALFGTDNEYTTHGTGIDYLGKFGLRFKNTEAVGYIESYEDIGYRAIGLQYSYVLPYKKFDFLAGLETSIISRYEIVDRNPDGSILNDRWMEYYPSFGVNLETRWNITRHLAIGWVANWKTRPDIAVIGRVSTYATLYIKIPTKNRYDR